MTLPHIDTLAALTMIAALVLVLAMVRMHRNPRSSFDLTDLITTHGKIDNAKFCQVGAFGISSWVVFYMTLEGGLTEWAFWGYMGAWVGARAFSLAAAVKGQKTNGNGTHAAPTTPAPT